jgi:hypothetical protein
MWVDLEMVGMFLTRVLTPDTYRAAFFSWALFIVDIFNAFLSPRHVVIVCHRHFPYVLNATHSGFNWLVLNFIGLST